MIEPLLPGYGMTLGNSLRRVLLSSISGAAIVAFRAEGATHEFTTLPGVKEDLIQIMLNLKGVRFRVFKAIDSNGNEEEVVATIDNPQSPLRLRLEKKGAGIVVAGDIQPDSGVEVINPDHLIATLNAASDRIDLGACRRVWVGVFANRGQRGRLCPGGFYRHGCSFQPGFARTLQS